MERKTSCGGNPLRSVKTVAGVIPQKSEKPVAGAIFLWGYWGGIVHEYNLKLGNFEDMNEPPPEILKIVSHRRRS